MPAVTQAADTLTCTMGTWTGEPTSYDYQWKADGAAAGTDAATHTVTTDDVGKAATCIVTATNVTEPTAAPPSPDVTIADPAKRHARETMIRVLALALRRPDVAREREARRLPHLRGPAGHHHGMGHRSGVLPLWMERRRLLDPESVSGQPVGLGDGNRCRRAALDPDPRRAAVPVHGSGIRPVPIRSLARPRRRRS